MSVVFESVIYLCFFCDFFVIYLVGAGFQSVFFFCDLFVFCLSVFQGVPAGSRHVVRGGAACS